MTFTIITPCMNSEKTIERAINSVLSQTYDDYEYIIIDGESSDATVQIVERYVKQYPHKIKVVSEQDKGIYDAMNKGISLATGDIIGILSSNDYYEPNALETVKSAYKGDKYAILYGIQNEIDTTGRIVSQTFVNHKDLRHYNIAHATCFMTRDLYMDHGGYTLKYKSSSDYEFLLRMSKKEEVVFEPIDSVITNFTEGGISSTLLARLETHALKYEYRIISYPHKVIWDMASRVKAFFVKKITNRGLVT